MSSRRTTDPADAAAGLGTQPHPARPNGSERVLRPVGGVLLTRLLAPRLLAQCLPREELVERVVAGFEGRLVAVLAGAGYGKSTLLTLALRRIEWPWIWCSCDARISQPAVLIAHLAAGLARRFPGFGAVLEFRGAPVEQVAAFANEIVATIDEDFVIALDDVHTLEGAAAETLALLATDLPPQAHLAVAGRAPLPFALARMRAGRVVELDSADLALSEAEAAALLRAAGRDVDGRVLGELHRQTEGWVTGLILASQVRSADLEAALDSRGLFDYLAEEVFLGQPEELQRFLLDTSVLERFTPELAMRVSGRADAATLCDALVARNLFTIRLDAEGEWYRYHHLLAAFLRRRLAQQTPAQIAELHLRAAAAWHAAGDHAEACRHYVEAGAFAEAVDALEAVAEPMVTTPGGEDLARLLDAIPRPFWEDRPAFVLAEATLLFTMGAFEGSFAALATAIEQLVRLGEQERAALAFVRLWQSMTAAGTPIARRIALGERYVPGFPAEGRTTPVARILLAAGYAWIGRRAEAEAKLEAAMALPHGRSEQALTMAMVVRAFYLDYPQGRLERAVDMLDDAIRRLQTPGAGDLAYDPLASGFRGEILSDLGRHDEVLRDMGRYEEHAARRGMSGMTSRIDTWLRLAALAGLERWHEVETLFAAGPHPAPQPGQSHYAYRYLPPAAAAAAHRGDRGAVARYAALARAAIDAQGLQHDQPQTLGQLARTAAAVGLSELAAELVGAAADLAAQLGSVWATARVLLAEALVRGRTEQADGALSAALDLTASHGLTELWTRCERRHAAALLARAIQAGLGPPGQAARLAAACAGEVLAAVAERLTDAPAAVRAQLAEAAGEATDVDAEIIERLLRDRDADVREAARRSRQRIQARPRPPLLITSLGGFAVRRGELSVPASAFRRQRARALLAALLCAGRPVHREELLEWFWPELAPQRGLRALYVTLHGLRRALEPELARGAAASVISTDGETYRVRLADGDVWDAARFLELAAQGAAPDSRERRLEQLGAAEEAYTGVLFPEWPYAEWAQVRRTEVEAARRQVLETLGALSLELGQAVSAIAPYRALVALEPERERWHRALMEAYERAGERALALRQYHACRKVIRAELGVEPSAETRALYQELLGAEPALAG